MSATYIKKKIDQDTSFLYDRKEVVTAPMWTTDKESLLGIYTSSNQPHHQKIYYRNVYSNNVNTSSIDVEFTIAYGNILNSGSSTGSFGLIEGTPGSVSESYTNYTQYRNLLSDYETINTFTSGSFTFRGLGNTDIGPYIWGSTNYLFNTSISSPKKLSIPNVVSYRLNSVKSLGIRSTKVEHNIGNQKIYFITADGNMYRNYPNTELFDSSEKWKQLSVGATHQLAIKEDGTLWSWGLNDFGELGFGFNSNTVVETPTKVGTFTDWEYVFAGNQISLGLRDGGKLYAWGYNQSGLLGFGDNSNRSTPERIGTDTWKKITASNVLERTSDEYTILGIKTDGQMYGWGSNNNFKITTNSSSFEIQKEPVLMDPMGDETYPMWKDVSAGDGFIIAIMDSANTLYGWGNNSGFSELGTGGSYYVTTTAQQIGISDNWESVHCGFNYTIALNSSAELYGWGSNEYDQQGRGFGASNVYSVPTKITNVTGWTNISTSEFMTFASIGISDNRRTTITSEDIYVINIPRKNYRDKLNAGSWELSLTGISYDSNRNAISDTTKITTLVDETVDLIGTADEYPIYSPTNNGSIFYGIYSGSLKDGIHNSAKTQPYGLIYPYHGLMILNGELLLKSASIQTRRTEPTASGAFHKSSNADILFTSISGAMSVGKPFTAKTVEVMSPTYCFINIGSGEFNTTFNPSFYFNKDKFIVKKKLKNDSNPFTYITTIGLYNDEDDLLAVAKLSKPIKKSTDTELVVKVKLDI